MSREAGMALRMHNKPISVCVHYEGHPRRLMFYKLFGTRLDFK